MLFLNANYKDDYLLSRIITFNHYITCHSISQHIDGQAGPHCQV